MGVPSEKVENATRAALSAVEYALQHVEPDAWLDRNDLEAARKSLRCIVSAHTDEAAFA